MNDTRFQQIVKWGGLALALAAIGNLYLLLRYREVYRDATRIEAAYPQEFNRLAAQERALEGVVQDYATKAGRDAGVVEILRRHGFLKEAKR